MNEIKVKDKDVPIHIMKTYGEWGMGCLVPWNCEIHALGTLHIGLKDKGKGKGKALP